MAASALRHETVMTESEYLNRDFEIAPDFVDGHLEERNVGEIEHTNWQRALMRWFLADHGFAPLIASPEVTVQVSPGHIRIADVALFAQPPQGLIVTAPPVAVIEILSSSDTFRRLKERMQDYQRMGVRNLFVIESRSAFSAYGDGQFIPVLTGRSLLEGTDAFIDWREAASLLWPNDIF